MDGNAILKWLPLVVVVGTGVAAWSDLRSDADNLEKRLDKLEEAKSAAAAPAAPIVRVTKGDLCQQLVTGLTGTSDRERIKMLTGQIARMDCYAGVAAYRDRATPSEMNAVSNAVHIEPSR